MNALGYYLIIIRLFDTVSKLGMFIVRFKINICPNKHFISGTHSHTKIHTHTHTKTYTYTPTHNVLVYIGRIFVHTEVGCLPEYRCHREESKDILSMDY